MTDELKIALLCSVAAAAITVWWAGSLLARHLVGVHRARQHVPDVVVTLTLDTSGFETAMRKAADAVNAMSASIGAKMLPAVRDAAFAMERMMDKIKWQREVKLAGLGARYHVRGGAGCETEQEVLELAADLLAGRVRDCPHTIGLWPWTTAERAELAVEALRGWVLHHDGPRPAARWHDWGRTMVKVGDA